MTTTDTLVPFAEAMERYEPVIGLETHVELGTRTKMFCGCTTIFGAPPNSQVCPVCLGLPGSLPVVNRMAIEYTIRIGLALNCTIATWCRFARKNYFYPDMPKNFQISQYDEPLCTDGWLDVPVADRVIRVGIERVHLEEDTGKSLHVGGATGRIHGADYSLVDYNRAGIPLVEIVTKPVEGTGAAAPEVARAYVTELRDLVRGLGVSDVRMEEGSLRCDVNTSLAPRGSGRLGTRTETKNVNSLRSVERAVRSEIERQAAVLDSGARVIQETRHFHEDSGTTTSGRSKEEAQDYRYFPEPDLVPVAPSAEWVEQIRAALPEVPSRVRARLRAKWNVSEPEMDAIVNAGALDLVAETVTAGASPADARKWWLGELARRANDAGLELSELAFSPAQVAGIAEQVPSTLAIIPAQVAQMAEDAQLAFTPALVARIAEQLQSALAFTPALVARIAEQLQSALAFTSTQAVPFGEDARMAFSLAQVARMAEDARLAFTPDLVTRMAENARVAFTPAQVAQMAEQLQSAIAVTPASVIPMGEDAQLGFTPAFVAQMAQQLQSAIAVTPAQVARIAELVSSGALNDRLARDVVDAVLAREGEPDEVVSARGLAVVSDEGALTAAVDAAIAAQPDVAAKVRAGKVTAAGPLIGAVMKATGGKADAARVSQLILERLTGP